MKISDIMVRKVLVICILPLVLSFAMAEEGKDGHHLIIIFLNIFIKFYFVLEKRSAEQLLTRVMRGGHDFLIRSLRSSKNLVSKIHTGCFILLWFFQKGSCNKT